MKLHIWLRSVSGILDTLGKVIIYAADMMQNPEGSEYISLSEPLVNWLAFCRGEHDRELGERYLWTF